MTERLTGPALVAYLRANPTSDASRWAADALDAADVALKEASEVIAARNAEIARLQAAIIRQVHNIERWLETGAAASAEESKSIYEQLRAAMGGGDGS